jgi:hexosaminidase
MIFRIVTLTVVLSTLCMASASPALIPLPQLMQVQPGAFTLTPTQTLAGTLTPAATKILVDGATRQAGEYLATVLAKSTGWRFEVATNSGTSPVPQAILLTTNNALLPLGNEGYELTVTTNSVLIRAPAPAGAFYGVQSLLQLLPPEILASQPVTSVAWTAPCVYIQDAPRFRWRGWMLDSVRHFFNKDEVKHLLDAMALHKLNVFHWHLDDDAGWRIEIKKWPLLTEVSAWRTNILFGLNPRSSTAWRAADGLYGGYYSQEDIREIVAYAAQRHIMIVPEIEMPGHSTAALKAYPQFGCGCPACASNVSSIDITNSNASGVFCAARPETMAFLRDVLTEVMELFPGPYIHIGGDEVNFSNWHRHSLDQALTNSLGTASMQSYQSYFTQQIADWIASQGKTMIGWSEILNGGLVTNAVLMDWHTATGSRALKAATNGQFVVMSPLSHCYINFVENPNMTWSNEPPSQPGTITLSTAYSFEPIPPALPAAFTNFILGAQGNSWAEYIPSLLNMEFKAYPRLCALAEVNWTSPSLKNYADFVNRLATHSQRLTQMGVNYNRSVEPLQLGNWTPAQTPATYATQSWDITASVTGRGEIDISFCWKTGSHGLDIAWVALLENGVEIDRDPHAGFTGVTPVKPAYVLRLPARRPGATYTIQALVQGRGGTNSSGIIYRPNWN